jgi:hypothetical protein
MHPAVEKFQGNVTDAARRYRENNLSESAKSSYFPSWWPPDFERREHFMDCDRTLCVHILYIAHRRKTVYHQYWHSAVRRGTRYASVHCILPEQQSHHFHIRLHDAPARRAFCQWILQQSVEDRTLIAKVLFINESCFIRTPTLTTNMCAVRWKSSCDTTVTCRPIFRQRMKYAHATIEKVLHELFSMYSALCPLLGKRVAKFIPTEANARNRTSIPR